MKVFAYLALVFPAVLWSACNVAPAPVALNDEPPIRAAAHDFTSALRAADETRLQQTTTVDPDPDTQKLAQSVVADTLTGRRVQLLLQERFHSAEQKSTVIGSDAWITQIEDAAAHGQILQTANRVRIGESGRDGTLFLRNMNGQWKVEIVPTLVAESGGRTRVSDPVVDYRFNVTNAVNQYLLTRLQQEEFSSVSDYQQAKNKFWFQYLTYAANGDDPHDKLLHTLPPIPKETEYIAKEH